MKSNLHALVLQMNADQEMEAYRSHLENVYHVCRRCEATVYEVLDRQDRILKKRFRLSHANSHTVHAKHARGANGILTPRNLSKDQNSSSLFVSL